MKNIEAFNDLLTADVEKANEKYGPNKDYWMLGCEHKEALYVDRIELAELIIGYVMKFDFRQACIQSRIYLRKYGEKK